MEHEEECMTGLCLGLGIGGNVPKKEKQKVNYFNKHVVPFELCPKGEAINMNHHNNKVVAERINLDAKSTDSNSEDNTTNNKNGCRKKLRLTKEQSAMLENSFKLHTTLNHAQKQALADQLNLKTRQIEVWFQNRRARTKLKQTEVDRELLKKHCQNLSEENRRLKKELQELRALKVGCIQLSKATTTFSLCSSCHKLSKLDEPNKLQS